MTRSSVATGDDVIYGQDGDDSLNGEGGNDSVYGGAGDDTLVRAGFGNPLLDGGDGSDYFDVTAWLGNPTVNGGEGGTDQDTLSFASEIDDVRDPVNVSFSTNEAGTASFVGRACKLRCDFLSDRGGRRHPDERHAGCGGGQPPKA